MKKVLMAVLLGVSLGCHSNAQKKSPDAEVFKVTKSEEQWKRILDPQEYAVLRKAVTERAHSSPLNHIEEPGVFVCAGCGNELYRTQHKFDSGTGWPSFDRPITGAVAYGADSKLGYQRDEVHCADCGGHLGHVFDDGPRETTGKRHCLNGAALKFIPDTPND